MDRRQFLFRTSLLAIGTAFPFKKVFARGSGTFTPLRRNVGYFTGKGGTIGWLAGDDAMVVVDAQYPETARHCLNGLKERSTHALDLLINTHHHRDHTAGNPVFEDEAGKMVAHENVPKLMKMAAEQGDNDYELALPRTTFATSWHMDVGDEQVHAQYYGPGHTSGDAVIYFEKANVVHTGDLVFNRMNPYTDRPAGASITNWIESLRKIEDDYPADAMYIFGHGKPEYGVTGNREDVAVMREYFTAMMEYVQGALEQGKPKEEILDKKVLDGFENFMYADFWTLPKNLDIAYTELTNA
ncbi:MAG: MBL fold metallo-hydrolase [Balneolaceae bacterium]|jgi:glyoxylase-like metal-dependent hydrolase (beta-lactamase superfamily II)